jgi:hypothetical protein
VPRTTNFLTRQRQEITARLEELRPLYEEYLTLEKAQQALEDLGEPIRRALGNGRRTRRSTGRSPGRPRGSGTKRGPGRPRGSGKGTARRTTARRTTGRRSTGRRSSAARGRGRAGGTRADQAFEAIKSNPGITIPDLAKRLNVRPNYLYRVTQGLEKDRRVRRDGRGFRAA